MSNEMTQLPEVNATSLGAEWAMDDPELARLYPGKWAVAIPNQLIAVGDDADAVRAEAAEKLGLPANSLVLAGIASLDSRIHFWR